LASSSPRRCRPAFPTRRSSDLADTEAIGWSRNANYDACKFCLMLAGRGALYRKRETTQFAAHTDCQCTYVPVFRNGEHGPEASRSEEHTSELQSRENLVCRLLL